MPLMSSLVWPTRLSVHCMVRRRSVVSRAVSMPVEVHRPALHNVIADSCYHLRALYDVLTTDSTRPWMDRERIMHVEVPHDRRHTVLCRV